MDIEALIAGGETFEVEFKGEERSSLNDRDLIDAIVCLANGRGGNLLVGIEDDGRVTGARPRHEAGSTDPARLQALIAARTQPPVRVEVDVVEVRGQDPLEFERLRRLIDEAGGRGDGSLAELSDLEIAKALGVVVANHEVSAVRTGALLLFGREAALARLLPTHEAAFQALWGTAVEANEFFRWPLLRLAEEFLTRFRARNREEEIQFGLVRVSVPEFSEVAFREALANALIHRDYTRLGAVHVQFHDDRLEISNPGGFPSGIRLDNLLVAPPRPRNPLLADAFKRAGIVERTGRGINRI